MFPWMRNSRLPVTHIFSAFSMLAITALLPSQVWAQQGTGAAQGSGGIDLIIRNIIKEITSDAAYKLLIIISITLGFFFLFSALKALRLHVDQSVKDAPTLQDVLLKFLAAGFFYSLPVVGKILIDTLKLDSGTFDAAVQGGRVGTGGGLDNMMMRLMTAIYYPLKAGLPSVCYLFGLILAMLGIRRLASNPGDNPRGPAGRGTLMTFFTAAVLMAVGSAFDRFEVSLFGRNITNIHMVLSYPGTNPAMMSQINTTAIPAVLMFVSVLGWIAFIRGWLILRALADGQQASMAAGITHIIGGVLAANLPSVLQAVQKTLGPGAAWVQVG